MCRSHRHLLLLSFQGLCLIRRNRIFRQCGRKHQGRWGKVRNLHREHAKDLSDDVSRDRSRTDETKAVKEKVDSQNGSEDRMKQDGSRNKTSSLGDSRSRNRSSKEVSETERRKDKDGDDKDKRSRNRSSSSDDDSRSRNRSSKETERRKDKDGDKKHSRKDKRTKRRKDKDGDKKHSRKDKRRRNLSSSSDDDSRSGKVRETKRRKDKDGDKKHSRKDKRRRNRSSSSDDDSRSGKVRETKRRKDKDGDKKHSRKDKRRRNRSSSSDDDSRSRNRSSKEVRETERRKDKRKRSSPSPERSQRTKSKEDRETKRMRVEDSTNSKYKRSSSPQTGCYGGSKSFSSSGEIHNLPDTLDADVKRWSRGKENNLRALLSTLQDILGPESGWKPIPLTDLESRKAYGEATLYVHPDKLQQRGASTQQKYICEKVFDLLKEAWDKCGVENDK